VDGHRAESREREFIAATTAVKVPLDRREISAAPPNS
jgi:hypothetical protein